MDNKITVYVVLEFDRTDYPSTTKYITVFRTEDEAQAYVEEYKKEYNRLSELYYIKEII